MQVGYSKPQKVTTMCKLDGLDYVLGQEAGAEMKTALQHPFLHSTLGWEGEEARLLAAPCINALLYL